jgi:hypothetical protein
MVRSASEAVRNENLDRLGQRELDLGNMRANGVPPLDVSCWQCHHRAIMSADPWSDDVPVPTFRPRMVCTRCGIVGADARPNWREQPGAGERRAMAAVRPRKVWRGVEQNRALRLLAGSPLGCTETIMLAHGFTTELASRPGARRGSRTRRRGPCKPAGGRTRSRG